MTFHFFAIMLVTSSKSSKFPHQPAAESIRRLCHALKVEPNYFFDDAAEETSALEFALYGEVRQLTEEDKQDVLEFARFKRALREKRRDE